MGVKFPGKKRYVTLEWPLKHKTGVDLQKGANVQNGYTRSAFVNSNSI